MNYKSSYSKSTKRSIMPVGKLKEGSKKAPSGIPSIPSLRPVSQRNRPARPGFNPGSYK